MSNKGNLLIGWGMADITPQKKTALRGQFYDRISEYVRDPLMATALAVQGSGGSGFIMVTCDLCMLNNNVLDCVRDKLADKIKDFNIDNLFIMATHTHTAPYLSIYGGKTEGITECGLTGLPFRSPVYNTDILSPDEYMEFLVSRITDAAADAWKRRKKAGISNQLGHAVVGHNRRVTYEDNTAQMYGGTDTIYYKGPEGPADHGVELLYIWDEDEKLTGVVANVACPSQIVEHERFVSADYWGETRKKFWKEYGSDVMLFPMCGAAGDQSPWDMVRRGRGDKNMGSEEGLYEIAERIVNAIRYKFESARETIDFDPEVGHKMKILELPYRRVSNQEYEEAKKVFDILVARYGIGKNTEDKSIVEMGDLIKLHEVEGIIFRYHQMLKSPVWPMEYHFVRIGDIAVATNPFEIFTEYGLMIKARSVAQQTFLAQLACGSGGYLATSRAVQGGHYSARIADGVVGPEGGKLLVEYTVSTINEFWNEKLG